MTNRHWLALSVFLASAYTVPAGAVGIKPSYSPRTASPKAIKRQKLAALHRRIGFELCEHRDFYWAVRHFREALHFQPGDAHLHATLGDLYGAQKALRPAERQLRAAVRLDPKNTSYLERLGVILERQDRPREAASVYKNVIWVDNRDAAAHQHLGFAFERQGKIAAAIQSYQTALKLDPKNLPARWRLNRLVPPPRPTQPVAKAGRRRIARGE
jgi:cytochrome c-type biogenesis protein CcmH/NrfG